MIFLKSSISDDIIRSKRESCFSISVTNPAYEYFHDEFRSLPRDQQNSIIYASGEITITRKKASMINKIKVILGNITKNRDVSYRINKSARSYNYFDVEYRNNISKDIDNNIIVPADEVTSRIR